MLVSARKSFNQLSRKTTKGFLTGGLSILLAAPVCQALTNDPAAFSGNIPEGMWVLNQERSNKFMPGTHTLWIIKDDGHRLVWVSVETDPKGQNLKVTSWDGVYGGAATEVKGSGMMTVISSPGKGRMLNQGEIPGLGSYEEDCTIMNEGRRMRCEFTLHTGEGSKTYIDDFDWFAAGPSIIQTVK